MIGVGSKVPEHLRGVGELYKELIQRYFNFMSATGTYQPREWMEFTVKVAEEVVEEIAEKLGVDEIRKRIAIGCLERAKALWEMREYHDAYGEFYYAILEALGWL